MNNRPGVGVTGAPTPAAAPEPAVCSRAPHVPGDVVMLTAPPLAQPPVPRLDAAFFADPERVRAMVAHWSRNELYMVGNVLIGEGDRLIEDELLAVLRTMCAREPGEPSVTHVEFVTNPNYDDQVYWDDESVYLRIKGRDEPVPIEFADVQDGSQEAALDARFCALLADYARSDPPNHGDHLVVNLATGAFERSGKWSLV